MLLKNKKEKPWRKSHWLLQSAVTEDSFHTYLKNTVLQKSFVIYFVGILDKSIFSLKFLKKEDLKKIIYSFVSWPKMTFKK